MNDDHLFAYLCWAPKEIVAEEAKTPVTLFSGFLGSGKTTLLKHLLREQTGSRVGLIVNDVGEVNIDAEELRHHFPEETGPLQLMSELTQGCICCSIGDELADALVHLRETRQPRQVWIEASGVANPRNILQTFYRQNFGGHSLLDVYRIANLITVVDSAYFLREWKAAAGDKSRKRRIFLNDPRKPYLELLMEQIETCDVLVLNKQDLLSPAEKKQVADILSSLNPRAAQIPSTEGRVEQRELFEPERFELRATQGGSTVDRRLEMPALFAKNLPKFQLGASLSTHPENTAGHGLSTTVFRARRPFRSREFFRALRSEIPGLLRAKGFYWTEEDPEYCGLLSLAGGVLRADIAGHWYVDLIRQGKATLDAMPEEVRSKWEPPPLGDRRQEIVLIGVDLDAEDIQSRLEACLCSAPATVNPSCAPSPDVIIVGAGPAGLGLAVHLRELGIQNVVIVDAQGIGASFRNWPQETRLLTPSFPSDAYGAPDLNSVFPGESPARATGYEHLNGTQYADWLEARAHEAHLQVQSPLRVETVHPTGSGFHLETSGGPMDCRCLVWATGEFFFPRRPAFPGSYLALHYADVKSWSDWPGRRVVVLGGAESGIDAACNLVRQGKQVTVLDCGAAWLPDDADPSTVLSPRTRERLCQAQSTGRLCLVPDARATRIEEYSEGFGVYDQEGRFHGADTPPILCCGFEGGASQIRDLWDWQNTQPLLTNHDESTRTPGLFLVGPQVRHPGEIFCFIYKFRTRFPLVAKGIRHKLDSSAHTRTLETST